jgi:translocation and assembly module TamB
MKRLKLDIGIEAPARVFVRGRGLDSEWGGNLKISGTAAEPSIRGDVSVVRGKYNFFGKIFSLSKGFISFSGGQPPMPRFDVTAEHQLPDMTARIRITGSPSAPDIQIESDPPLPEDEVLARLLFGRSAGDMTPFQALRLAQAVNAMRGGGGNIMSFFDRTRRLLGVDQLDIRRSDQNGGGTSVSAGKYVSENVYLEVEKGLDSESGKVSAEVELTPNVTVESEAGVDSGSGIGINWKWDY